MNVPGQLSLFPFEPGDRVRNSRGLDGTVRVVTDNWLYFECDDPDHDACKGVPDRHQALHRIMVRRG